MAEFSTEVWLALGAVIVVAALAFLHTLAAAARNEIAAHDLKARVARLRIEYYRRIQEDGGAPPPGEVLEVGPADEVEDGGRLAA
jgi:heme exporter protein D